MSYGDFELVRCNDRPVGEPDLFAIRAGEFGVKLEAEISEGAGKILGIDHTRNAGSGVNVRFVLLLSFGLSAALGALAGLLDQVTDQLDDAKFGIVRVKH